MKKASIPLLKWATVGILAGLLAGCMMRVSMLVGGANAIWANWQALGMPPERPSRFLAVGNQLQERVVVGTSGEKVYACCEWHEVDTVLPEMSSWEDSPALIYVLNIPRNAIDVQYSQSCMTFCGNQSYYVIRSDGSVWTWSNTNYSGQPAYWAGLYFSDVLWLLGGLLSVGIGAASEAAKTARARPMSA